MIVRLIREPSFEVHGITGVSGAAALSSGGASKPTARDNRYAAAHEAGHALLYAALGDRLPTDVKLVINNHSDGRCAVGFITDVPSQHQLAEKSFVEWYMLVFLAGKLGEEFIHGGSTLGSRSDYLRWLGLARSYLANHYRGIYYVEPQNMLEQKQNEDKLEALRTEQLAMLGSFFNSNADVFKELVGTLLEKREMGRDDLIPFLGRVKLPLNFPLPFDGGASHGSH